MALEDARISRAMTLSLLQRGSSLHPSLSPVSQSKAMKLGDAIASYPFPANPSSTITSYTENEMRHNTLNQCQPPAITVAQAAYQMSTQPILSSPLQLPSAYTGDFVYDSYGPIYNLGSNPRLEEHYARLFRIDEHQCWISPPNVAHLKMAHQFYASDRDLQDRQLEKCQEQLQIYTEMPRVVARRSTNVHVKTAANANACAPSLFPASTIPPFTAQHTKRRASTIQNIKTNNAAEVQIRPQQSMPIPEAKTYIVEKSPPQSVPPPKQIISGCTFGTDAILLRRIASFLDEVDAFKLAKSSRCMYEILDYSWWISVYLDIKRDDKGKPLVLWPCSSGWCDNCEKYHAVIYVHEISKARLCSKCADLPELQNIKISEARNLHKLHSKMSLSFIKVLPFNMHRRGKMYWKPHIKWVEENSSVDYRVEAKLPVSRQRGKASAMPIQGDASSRQDERSCEAKKRAIRLKIDASKYNRIMPAEPETSSTLEQQSPIQEASSSSFVPTSASADEDGEEEQRDQVFKRQKRIETQEEAQVENYDVFKYGYNGPSSGEIAREVRYNYLRNEAVKVGLRLPEWGVPLSGTLLHFINGEWEELEKQSIGINDFGGMIHHLQEGTF